MCKKRLLLLTLSFLSLVTVLCPLAAQDAADIVVLMDTSGTVLPWFDQIHTRVLPDITRRFIRQGDTVHLISFNARVNLELVQPIENEADISRVVSRFMLLYPLGKNSDFLSGLKYTWQYISTLDQQRQKIIIVISDGIFNPPDSSPYFSYSLQEVQDEVDQAARRIRGAGWHVYYIKIPWPEDVAVLSLDGSVVTERRKADNLPGENPPAGLPDGLPDQDTAVAAAQDPYPQTETGSGTAVQPESAREAENPAGNGQNPPDRTGIPETAGDPGREITPDAPVSAPPENSYYDISEEFTGALDIPRTEIPEDADQPLEFTDSVLHLPRITFPENLGKQARFFTLPLEVENTSGADLNMHLIAVESAGYGDILEKSVFLRLAPGKHGSLKAPLVLPEEAEIPAEGLPLELRFADNLRVDPQQATVQLTLVSMTAESFFRTNGFYLFTVLLILLAVAALIVLLVLLSRRIGKPAKEIRKASEGRPETRRSPVYAPQAEKETLQSVQVKPSAAQATLSAAASSADTEESRMEKRQVPAKRAEESSKASALQALFAESAPAERGLPAAPKSAETGRRAAAASAGTGAAAYSFTDRKEKYGVLGGKTRFVKREAGFAAADPHTSVSVSDSEGKITLNLFVEEQNTRIGRRNVHQMRAGSRLFIGGGASPFLIFLVKFPPNLAEVRYDGKRCSLALLKPEYFPYEKTAVIEDCLDRPVTAVSDKGYPVTFMLRRFEDPVVVLNRFLNSINE